MRAFDIHVTVENVEPTIRGSVGLAMSVGTWIVSVPLAWFGLALGFAGGQHEPGLLNIRTINLMGAGILTTAQVAAVVLCAGGKRWPATVGVVLGALGILGGLGVISFWWKV